MTSIAVLTCLACGQRARREVSPGVWKCSNCDAPKDGDRDGDTFDPVRDGPRLNTQARRVWDVMVDMDWHTVKDIAARTGDPETSIGSRMRDYRKNKFGSHTVEARRVAGGLWEFRLTL